VFLVYFILFMMVALNPWRSTANILSWLYKQSLSDTPFVISSMEVEDGLKPGTATQICSTKRIEPISVMIAIVTAIIAASVVTIFTAVELEKLKAKQQKADIVVN
jgi:hypothetical protein